MVVLSVRARHKGRQTITTFCDNYFNKPKFAMQFATFCCSNGVYRCQRSESKRKSDRRSHSYCFLSGSGLVTFYSCKTVHHAVHIQPKQLWVIFETLFLILQWKRRLQIIGARYRPKVSVPMTDKQKQVSGLVAIRDVKNVFYVFYLCHVFLRF